LTYYYYYYYHYYHYNHYYQTGSGVHPTSYPVGTGVKAAGA
jgi:hypothetical protein